MSDFVDTILDLTANNPKPEPATLFLDGHSESIGQAVRTLQTGIYSFTFQNPPHDFLPQGLQGTLKLIHAQKQARVAVFHHGPAPAFVDLQLVQ